MEVGNDRDGICSDSCIQFQWFELCDYINFVIKPLDKMMTIELKCEQHEAKEREWDIETDRERKCDEKKEPTKKIQSPQVLTATVTIRVTATQPPSSCHLAGATSLSLLLQNHFDCDENVGTVYGERVEVRE